jgi:hypothetical protein
MCHPNDFYFIFNFEAICVSKCWRSRHYYTTFYDDLHEEFNVPCGGPARTLREALRPVLCYLKTVLPDAPKVRQQLRRPVFCKRDDYGRQLLYGIAEVKLEGDLFVFGENDGCRRVYDQIESYAGDTATSLETLALQLKTFYPKFAQEDHLLLARLECDLKLGRVNRTYKAANSAARRRSGWKRRGDHPPALA